MIKTISESEIGNIKIEDSIKKWTLNYTDLVKNSNKTYDLEILKTDKGIVLYSSYGRTGGTLAKDYRMCDNQFHAEREAEKIVKSKTKKGYIQIELVKADIGSELGKSKVLSNSISIESAQKAGFIIKEENVSSLHPAVQNVVKSWFGSIDKFVVDTLDTSKCALGQLSLEQINKGRDLLLEARKLVSLGTKDIQELNTISSKYYSNIPMNFGYRKLDIESLRFDNNDKLDTAFDILDTLEGAKDFQKIITKKNAIDEQYKSLKTEMTWIDPSDPKYKWIDTLFHKTRADNHHFLGKMKIHNVFELSRNTEYNNFITMAEDMAKKDQARKELPKLLNPIWKNRFQENKAYEDLMVKANILPLFHGTRTTNLVKIISTKLKSRKPGFTVAGSLYDDGAGIYFADSASKSINYASSSGSYWSNGTDKKGYLFLTDVVLGKQKIATGPHKYNLNGIFPNMSVWAKGGLSGVINDEFIVFTENQNWLKYVIEFETKI